MYPARCKLSLTTHGARGDQRVSVISSTSSNTTSGIVSDRVHSEDEPDTAPASTECLPHLTETAPYSAGQGRALNGSNTDAGNHSMPPSPVSIIDGKFARARQRRLEGISAETKTVLIVRRLRCELKCELDGRDSRFPRIFVTSR